MPLDVTQTRFMAKVCERPDGCWDWTAAQTRGGYGQFYLDGQVRRAHRVAYELFVGPIPEGLQLDHLCRNRSCVNPAHLDPVTPQENWRRGNSFSAVNSRITHCKNGHPFDGENLRVSGGRRNCRACVREASKRYAQKRRAEAAA